MLQALDVTAETDGRSPQRTEYRPFGSGSALGQAWPAIGAVLLLLAILGCCLVWHWRRRSRRLQRICDAILERCRSCRQGSTRFPSTVRLGLPLQTLLSSSSSKQGHPCESRDALTHACSKCEQRSCFKGAPVCQP